MKNENSPTPTTFDYHAYLASREWALLKNQVRERSKGICERCGLGSYQETHHRTYARIGHEQLEDLQALCRACHQWESGQSNFDPARLVPEGSGSLVDRFTEYGNSLTLNAGAFDQFNQYIQAAIEVAPLELATQLAQVKLITNRRFYEIRRHIVEA